MTAGGSMPRLPRPADTEYRAFGVPATFGEAVPMLELRLASGNRVGLPYPWLAEVGYDPAAGVTLAYTTGAAVTIRGRNLLPLFAALVTHQAVWVWEADPPTAALAGDQEPVVEAVRVDRSAP